MKRVSKTRHKPLTKQGRLRIGLSLVWLFVLLLLSVAGGCTQTEVEEDGIPPHILTDVDAGFNLNVLATRTPVTRSITFTPNGTIEADTLAVGVKDSIQTKATSSLTEVQENQIASLWIGQYDVATGRRLSTQYLSSVTATTVNLKLKQSQNGSKSHVYFVSNAGDLGAIADETTLKKHTLIYGSTAEGLPDNNLCKMMGKWEGVVAADGIKDITVELTRLVSWITFTYSTGPDFIFKPSIVVLKNVPDVSQVEEPTGQLVNAGYKSYTGTISDSGATIYWYLAENMAGTVSGSDAVDSEKKKIGTGVTNATCFELTGDAVQGGITYKDVTFRFYPGNSYNNYDIVRNAHYTVNVTLVGIDVSDERITVGEVPPIEVDPTEMPAKKGGEKEIRIIARPGQEWVFDMPSWLSAVLNGQNVPSGATLTYQGPANVKFKAVDANPKAEKRTASFEIDVDVNGSKQTVGITQSGSTLIKGGDISLAAASESEGASSFTATEGLRWSAALSGDWLSWSATNPGTSGSEVLADAQVLKVKATSTNPSAQTRTGKITVKAGVSVEDATYTNLKQEIIVEQAGSIVAGSTVDDIAAKGGSRESSFTATKGLDWAASVASGNWLTLIAGASGTPTTGVSQTIKFDAVVNPSSSPRTGQITVRAGDTSAGPTGDITVNQLGATLSVSESKIIDATASTGNTSTFTATSGLSWNVGITSNDNWLSLTSAANGNNSTTGTAQDITYNAVVNPNSTSRDAMITVKVGNAVNGADPGLTKTVSIKQSGSTFSVDKTVMELANTATSGTVMVKGTSGLYWTVSPAVETNGFIPVTTSSTANGSDQTLTFNATENPGGARSARFTVSVTGGNHSKTVEVKQAAGFIYLTIDQSVLTSYKTEMNVGLPLSPFDYDGSNRLPNGCSFDGNVTMTGSYTIQIEKGLNDDKLQDYAAQKSYCSDLNEEGLTGWRIPTLIELYAVIVNKEKIESFPGARPFVEGYLWSSSAPDGASSYRSILSISGGWNISSLDQGLRVRCVRDNYQMNGRTKKQR